MIAQHQTFGYPRPWALLRFHEALPVNRKAPLPRAQGLVGASATDDATAAGARAPELCDAEQRALGDELHGRHLGSGRTFRTLNIVEDASRECAWRY